MELHQCNGHISRRHPSVRTTRASREYKMLLPSTGALAIRRNAYLTMYAISTSAFVSILALASSLVVVVRAGDPRPICATYYEVEVGVTTCSTLIQKYGLSVDTLRAMNPTITIECPDLGPGNLCVAQKSPACTDREPAPDATCNKFLSTFGLDQTRLYELNDDVNFECNNLKAGFLYCVSD